MNVIEGVQNDIERGVSIMYDKDATGILTIRNQDELTFRIRVQPHMTTISTNECVLDMKHIRVPHWDDEESFFPSYVSVSKGVLTVRNDGYWIMGAIALLLVKMWW